MTPMRADLEAVVRPTMLIEAPRLAQRLGLSLFLASETFQHTGSFKFRAAYSVASSVPQEVLIAASSGNFGQALAYACYLLKKHCIIVMPAPSVVVKWPPVRESCSVFHFLDVRSTSPPAR